MSRQPYVAIGFRLQNTSKLKNSKFFETLNRRYFVTVQNIEKCLRTKVAGFMAGIPKRFELSA